MIFVYIISFKGGIFFQQNSANFQVLLPKNQLISRSRYPEVKKYPGIVAQKSDLAGKTRFFLKIAIPPLKLIIYTKITYGCFVHALANDLK